MKHNQKTVVILGPHKSGTSALANAVANLGVPMGQDLLEAHESNPFGHFEDREFLKLNDDLILGIHRPWHSPPSRFRIATEAFPTLKEDFVSLIDRRNSSHDIWGFKDPRTTLSIHSLHPYLRNPYFLVMRRSTEDTARSLHSRDKDSRAYSSTFEYALDLTKYYLDESTLFIQKYSNVYPVHEVHYENLISEPHKTLKSVSSFLDLDLPDFVIEKSAGTIKQPDEILEARRSFKENGAGAEV